MSSPRKKRPDEEASRSTRPDGQPDERSATSLSPPVIWCDRSRSRPSWQPAAGHETDAGLTAMLQLYLDENYSSDATWRHRLVEVLLDQADQGNVRAIQEIWIRLEGKPGANDAEESKPPDIDPELTAKILEAGRTDDEDPPLD
ncbi:MAG: hypothetical protein ACLP7Q_08965 [Isosphaeraceae bacterium]